VLRPIQVVLVLLLLVYFAGPLFETVDQWDQLAQGTGLDDFETDVLSLVAVVALSVLIANLARWTLRASVPKLWPGLLALRGNAGVFLPARPAEPIASPPLSLRI
jgi:hypothetical protein